MQGSCVRGCAVRLEDEKDLFFPLEVFLLFCRKQQKGVLGGEVRVKVENLVSGGQKLRLSTCKNWKRPKSHEPIVL